MNNNNVRQISEEEIKQTLTKEELQQTQVLNLDELEKTIRIEKKTSKKPAILIATIGGIVFLFIFLIIIYCSAKKENKMKNDYF